jgi:methyltransferase (TIGR00027 family)
LRYVAELRYVQSLREVGCLQGPDAYVRYFIPAMRKCRLRLLHSKQLKALRSNPFYYYLIARTKFYDDMFREAIANDFKSIINIGCGWDTRSYRFGSLLKRHNIRMLECDQSGAITDRRRVAARLENVCDISYASVDLNGDAGLELERWVNRVSRGKVFVIMEGVSPYLDKQAFGTFLRRLAKTLPAGSRMAYDFKLHGCADEFGRTNRTKTPFRLTPEPSEIVAYHEELGFRVCHMELSSDLTVRVLSGLEHAIGLFRQDCLVQLEVL